MPFIRILLLKRISRQSKTAALTISYEKTVSKLCKAVTEGVVKVMSKMGISTVQSYRGAQIFEAVGIRQEVIDGYFTGTASQLGGIDLRPLQKKQNRRQGKLMKYSSETLDSGSDFQWRGNGEHHAFNPKTIHTLQWACRKGDYSLFKQYSSWPMKNESDFCAISSIQ